MTNRIFIAAVGAVFAHIAAGFGFSLLRPSVELEASTVSNTPRSIELKVVSAPSVPTNPEPAADASLDAPPPEREPDPVESILVSDAEPDLEPEPPPHSPPAPPEETQQRDEETRGKEDDLPDSKTIALAIAQEAERKREDERKRERETLRRRSVALAQAEAEAARQRAKYEEKLRRAKARAQTTAKRAAKASSKGVSRGPLQVTSPQPRYPRALERKRIGGTVAVAISIDARGRVSGVSVARGSGYAELDRAALAAVRRWRFKPAMKNGRKIASKTRVNIVFRPK